MAPPRTNNAPKGFRPETVLLLCGGIYIGALVLFFLSGEGLFAGYLALPGWIWAIGLVDVVPAGTPLESFLISPGGNILLLILGASINVISAYLILRLLLVWKFGERM
jgi:hypothetical protein